MQRHWRRRRAVYTAACVFKIISREPPGRDVELVGGWWTPDCWCRASAAGRRSSHAASRRGRATLRCPSTLRGRSRRSWRPEKRIWRRAPPGRNTKRKRRRRWPCSRSSGWRAPPALGRWRRRSSGCRGSTTPPSMCWMIARKSYSTRPLFRSALLLVPCHAPAPAPPNLFSSKLTFNFIDLAEHIIEFYI